MNPLSRILDETLRKLDLTEAADGARAVMLWPEIVGEQMAGASEARAIRAGALHVVTRSSAWSQELSFQKTIILRRFRDRLGSDAVRDLRFTVGKVRGARAAVPRGAPDEEVRRIRLSDEENARIATASETGDPELAQAIRRALTHEAQLRRWHLSHGAKECARCGAAYRAAADRCPACRQDAATAPDR